MNGNLLTPRLRLRLHRGGFSSILSAAPQPPRLLHPLVVCRIVARANKSNSPIRRRANIQQCRHTWRCSGYHRGGASIVGSAVAADRKREVAVVVDCLLLQFSLLFALWFISSPKISRKQLRSFVFSFRFVSFPLCLCASVLLCGCAIDTVPAHLNSISQGNLVLLCAAGDKPVPKRVLCPAYSCAQHPGRRPGKQWHHNIGAAAAARAVRALPSSRPFSCSHSVRPTAVHAATQSRMCVEDCGASGSSRLALEKVNKRASQQQQPARERKTQASTES